MAESKPKAARVEADERPAEPDSGADDLVVLLDETVDVAAEALRAVERKQLLAERDELLDKLDSGADDLIVLRAEVGALRQAAARAGVEGRTSFGLSEGVREELHRRGVATDPATGDALIRAEDGTVTATSRTGRVRTIDA